MKIIGHRGARHLCPENTIASIDAALEHHVDQIEIDVHVTKDGIVVLHHDFELVGADGILLPIVSTEYAELQQHRPDLVTLGDIIDHIAHRCPLVIEIKEKVDTEPVLRILKDRLDKGWKLDEFLVASFDFAVLRAVQTELPELTLIVNEGWSGVRGTRRARKLGVTRLAMDQRWLWSGFVRTIHRHGYELCPYPLNDPVSDKGWARYLAKIQRWEPYLYGIYTDRPDMFDRSLQ